MLTRTHDPRKNRIYREAADALHKAVATYLETGVAVLYGLDFSDIDERDWLAKRRHYAKEGSTLNSPSLLRKFMRNIAKEEGRPIAFAEIGGWYSGVYLTIPKLKRTAPVVAGLLLASSKPTRYVRYENKIICSYDSDGSNYYFRLNGEAGRELFESWLEQCRTDSVFRKALGAP